MSENIIIEIIKIGIPTLVSALSALFASRTNKKENAKNFAKNNILTLILDDQRRMDENRPIMNYQIILREFDEYSKNGGNSYVHDRVEEYKKEVADKYGEL